MKPNLRQRPWARIVVGLVCVLSLTLLAACGSQVVILAQGGAFRTDGFLQMRKHAAQTLAMEYTQAVIDHAYDLSNPPDESSLNNILDEPNFFYVARDENGNEIGSGGKAGEAQASWTETLQLDNGERRKVVRQTFDTEREMQEFINKLYQTYDDVQIREQYSGDDEIATETEGSADESSAPTSSTYYGLVAECITYGDERFVEVTGSLLSDMVDDGYAYETLTNLDTMLAQRSTLVAGTIFGGVLTLLCLLFLLWPDPVWPGVDDTDEAGDFPALYHRRPWLDRAVPTDLLVMVAGIVLLCCAAALSEDVNYQFLPGSTIAAALVGSLVLVPTLCSLVRRGREDALGENLLFRRILHPFGRFFRWMGGGLREAVYKLPLFWQAGLLFAGFGFLELLCFLGVWNRGAWMGFFWLLLKAVELIFFIRLVLQLLHLQEGGQKLTQGDLNYQLPLDKLHGPFRAHGEALNNVRQGIQHAVEEQMKSERMKTELLTNVSHDIKTPLTAIVSYVDLLKQEPMPNEKAKEYLDVLDRQSARLKKLTEDLVEASKATTGNLTVDLQTTDVNVFLGQTAGEYEERLTAKQLTLCLTPAEGTPVISADGRLLWRVFENLFSNIQKYAQPGTRVYLTCQDTETQVTITFRNISAEPLNISADELMERFVRGDASRNTEGSGLGLSIARSLTQLQHGTFALAVDGDLFKAILTFPRLRDGEG
jgi:signal transduction histidine kinase